MIKLLASVWFTLLATPAFANVEIGAPAPDFEAVDTNGSAVKLSELQGKTVVLEWTNHDCPFVVKHYQIGNMQKLQQAAKDDGVVWVRIISSAPGKQGHLSAEEANAIAAEQGAVAAHTLRDEAGDIGRLYAAKTTPHMYVINAQGALAYMGAIDSKASADAADIEGATNYVSAALSAIKAGQAPETTNTKPYGCSVKY